MLICFDLFEKKLIFKLQTCSKAELLQLNRTQFSSLGFLISKKLGIEKTITTFIISVLKFVYLVVLVFFNFQLLY